MISDKQSPGCDQRSKSVSGIDDEKAEQQIESTKKFDKLDFATNLMKRRKLSVTNQIQLVKSHFTAADMQSAFNSLGTALQSVFKHTLKYL